MLQFPSLLHNDWQAFPNEGKEIEKKRKKRKRNKEKKKKKWRAKVGHLRDQRGISLCVQYVQ